MREVGLVPAPGTSVAGGSTNEGAGELSASGEYKSLPVPSKEYIEEEKRQKKLVNLDEFSLTRNAHRRLL